MEYEMGYEEDRVRPYYVPISPHMTYHGSIGASTLMSPSLSPSSTITRSNSDSQLPRLPLAPCSRNRSNSDTEIAINNCWKIEFTPFGQQKKDDSSLPDLAAKEDSLGDIAGPEDFTENMEKYIKGTSTVDNNNIIQQKLHENPMGQASDARSVETPATVNAEIDASGDIEEPSDFTQNMEKYVKGTSSDDHNKTIQQQLPENPMGQAPEVQPVEIPTVNAEIEALGDVDGLSDFTANMEKYVNSPSKDDNHKTERVQEPENAVQQALEVQPVEVPEIFTEQIDILGEVEGPSDFTANMTDYMKGTLEAKKEELREESPEESYRMFEGKAPEAYTQYFDDFDAELTEPVACSTPAPRDLVTPQLEPYLLVPKQRGPPADNKDGQIDSLRRQVELLQSILHEREVLLMEQEEGLVEKTATMEGKDAEIQMLRKLNAEMEGKDTDLQELQKLNEGKDAELQKLRKLNDVMKGMDVELEMLRKLNAEMAGKDAELQKLRKLDAVMKGKNAELQVLRNLNATMEGKDAELHKLRKLNAVMEGKEAELQKLRTLNAEQELDIGRLETEADASQSLIQTLETKVAAHTTTIAALETEISALKSANEKLECTHTSQVDMMKSTHASQVDMMKVTHASQFDTLKATHASEIDILQAHSAAALASLQSRNMKLKSSLDSLHTDHTTTVAGIETEISDLKFRNDKLKGTHASHINKLKATHASELDIMKGTYASQIDKLKGTHTSQEVDMLKATHASQVDKLKSSHAAQVDTLKATHASEVKALQQSVEYWKRGAAVILKDRDEHVKRLEDLEAEKRNAGWRHASKETVISMGVRLVYT